MNARLTWFPKLLSGSDVATFARVTRAAGLDRCNAVIREGYPTPPGTLATTLRPFLDALRDGGVTCDFASTGWVPSELSGVEADLAALAKHGVTNVRLMHALSGGGWGKVGDVRAELDQAKRDFAAAAELAERHGLRFIYQVHHATLFPSPSSVWPIVRDLPPERMAVMLDPGNQAIEGSEHPLRSMRLLCPDRVAACGVKDVAWSRDADNAWSHAFVETGTGVCNWPRALPALAEGGFAGTLVFMPFYDVADPNVLAVKLKREVDLIRAHMKV